MLQDVVIPKELLLDIDQVSSAMGVRTRKQCGT